MIVNGAVFSGCRRYRYALERADWLTGEGTVLFVMLNPSTATETANDPTVTRCIRYAQRWEFNRLLVANIFAFRSTDPKGLLSASDPIGPENNRWIAKLADRADKIICAWGAHATVRTRAPKVLEILRDHGEPYALQLTASGFPQHPLYVRGDVEPVPLFNEQMGLMEAGAA